MADIAPYQNMNFRFAQLLEDLSKTWTGADIAVVRDLAAHSEYGEAMECLLALAARNGKPLTPTQSADVSDMCKALGMQVPVAKAKSSRPAASPAGPATRTPQPFPG